MLIYMLNVWTLFEKVTLLKKSYPPLPYVLQHQPTVASCAKAFIAAVQAIFEQKLVLIQNISDSAN